MACGQGNDTAFLAFQGNLHPPASTLKALSFFLTETHNRSNYSAHGAVGDIRAARSEGERSGSNVIAIASILAATFSTAAFGRVIYVDLGGRGTTTANLADGTRFGNVWNDFNPGGNFAYAGILAREVVPTPASTAMLGLGGLALSRRRR